MKKSNVLIAMAVFVVLGLKAFDGLNAEAGASCFPTNFFCAFANCNFASCSGCNLVRCQVNCPLDCNGWGTEIIGCFTKQCNDACTGCKNIGAVFFNCNWHCSKF